MFRGKIWKKLLITYMMFAMILFLVINYPVQYLWLYDNESDLIVEDIKDVVMNYESDYASDENVLSNNYLKALDINSGYSFLIVTAEGVVLRSTNDPILTGKSLNVINSDFVRELANLEELKSKKNTTLNGIINDPSVVVYDRLASKEDGTALYVVAYAPYTDVTDGVERILFILNVIALFVSVLAFFIFMVYAIYYTRASHYLIKMTAEYTDGKFDKKVKRKHYSDESEELANAIDCLAEKNEGLIGYQKNFVANISHDFRSPLTSIRGYTVALKDGTIPLESQGKYLDIILFETDRLQGLTQNILDLSEFDSNAVKLNLTEFDICKMVKQSAATFEAICASKKIKIRLILAEKSIKVKADRPKIQQVIHNLVDNAIKFSNENSLIEIKINEKDDKVYVSVRDHGIGIPQNSLHQVWERFYKTDLSRGKDKKGTGLGLSITKQIVNAHGEKIVVDSKVGEGTEFTFTLAKVVVEEDDVVEETENS